MKKRRFVSMLTAAALALTGYWPGAALTASAEPYSGAEVQQGSADIAYSDNTFGAMLAADINQENARIMSGCAVHGVELNEKVATVSFDAAQSGRAVVCVYTDPSGTDKAPQLLGSGVQSFTEGQTSADVSLQISALPAYYLVRVYLIGENEIPLSTEYTDATHTLEMQQLTESDISDYEGCEILNMDDSTETNFAVYEKDVQVLQQSSTENIVTLQDNENCIYKIQNYTGTTRTGTTVSIEGGNGTAAIFKIGSVKTEGNVTTIQGDRAMETADAFAYIKVETDSAGNEASYTPPELPEEYAHIPVSGGTAAAQRPAQGRPGIAGAEDSSTEDENQEYNEDEIHFRIQLGKGLPTGAEGESSGRTESVSGLEVDGVADFYFSYQATIYKTPLFDRVELAMAFKLDAGLELSASVGFKFPFGTAVIFNPCSRIGFTLGPYIVGTVTGIVTIGATFSCSYGSDKVFHANVCVSNFSLTVEGFLGVGLGGALEVLDHSGELSLEIGLKAVLEPNELHQGCNSCYQLTLSLEGRINANLTFDAFGKDIDFGINPSIAAEIGTFYLSDTMGFGFGDCPNLSNPPGSPADAPADWKPESSEDGLTAEQRQLFAFTELSDGYGVQLKNSTGAKYMSMDIPQIPDYYMGKPVVEIMPYAFSNIVHIRGVKLPKKLKRIGACAFSKSPENNYFSKFEGESVWFPDTLESVGDSAFSGNDIKVLTLPDSLQSIGQYAFSGGDFTSVVLPESLQSLGQYAFSGSALETVVFRDSYDPLALTVIPSYAFSSCESLKSVRFPAGLRKIEAYAFYKSCDFPLNLPSGVREIGDHAFWCNPDLAASHSCPLYNLQLPAFIHRIGQNVFGERYHINRLIFPLHFTGTVDPEMFLSSRSPSVKMVELPNNWKEVPAHFMEGCYIYGVKLPEALKTIGESAFARTRVNNITIPKTVTKIGKAAFRSDYYLEAVSIPQGVTEIAEDTFDDCDHLEKVVIPNSVKTIGNGAFRSCYKLSSITIPESVQTMYFGAFDHYKSNSMYSVSKETVSESDGSSTTTVSYNYSSPRTITFLNPNTQFLDDPETLKSDYIPEGGSKPTIEYGNFLTICGYPGSTAQAFAENPDHICRFVGLTSSSATVSEPTGEPQTMTFTGLLPNTVYNFYDLLGTNFTANNLLYLSQGISDENGTLTVWYRPRTNDTNAEKYVRCNDPSAADTPAVTTTAKPATPVTTTTAKPATPVVTTTAKPATPVTTTTAKPATPVGTTAVTTSRPVSTIQGDANGDFVVDVSDAVLVARFCAEDSSADITRQGILNADVNHNGSADSEDTILILRFIAKLIRAF